MPEPEMFSERKSSSMMTTGKRNFIRRISKWNDRWPSCVCSIPAVFQKALQWRFEATETSGFRQRYTDLPLILAPTIGVRSLADLVAFEEENLRHAFVRVDFGRQRCRIREFERHVTFPFGLERRHVHNDPAARIGGLAEANRQARARNPEILDRPRKREGVRRDDADVALEVDERFLVEILRVDNRRIDVGEDLEFVCHTNVITVAGRAIAHDLAAIFGHSHLVAHERLDHVVRFGHAPDPLVGLDAHRERYPTKEAA